MSNRKFEFNKDKLLVVDIDSIDKNNYNPKNLNTKEFKKVVKSIEVNGFNIPIIVRENPDKDSSVDYIIIDGQNRWLAAKSLGYNEIPVYNEGKVSEDEAKNLTLWYQVSVPFETIPLANLVTDLAMQEMELPYTPKEIAKFAEMIEFEGDDADYELDETTSDFKTFKVRLGFEAYEVLESALSSIKEENDCTDARAIELLAADYLSGK